jgi:hypothetical protein
MSPKESPEHTREAASGEDPHAALERALISQYLREHGSPPEKLHGLPVEQIQALMREASRYASAKLAELESRAQMVEEIHQATPSSD